MWFAEGGLVCTWAFPFPASAAVPSQGCQGSSSGLQHKINRRATFWLLHKSSQTWQLWHIYEENLSKLCDLSYFCCQAATCDGGQWNLKKKRKKVSHWPTRIVNSGDTNLIVCYLDAGRPMRWSYLCDRCSTPLHLQSQPAPSLQAVDLNSSESTQWEGKWWMECMESNKKLNLAHVL